MTTLNQKNEFVIKLPTCGKGKKEIDNLFKRRRNQLEKAINKLKANPTDYRQKGIEKVHDCRLGDYTIRINKNERLFYDVDKKNRIVFLLRTGPHDYYKLI